MLLTLEQYKEAQRRLLKKPIRDKQQIVYIEDVGALVYERYNETKFTFIKLVKT